MVASTNHPLHQHSLAVRLPPPRAPLLANQARPVLLAATLSTRLSSLGFKTRLIVCCDRNAASTHLFTTSVWLRYLELAGETFDYPGTALQDDYVWDIAATLHREYGDDYHYSAATLLPPRDSGTISTATLQSSVRSLLGETRYRHIHSLAGNAIQGSYRNDLEALGCHIDQWGINPSRCADDLNTITVTTSKGTAQIEVAPTVLTRSGQDAAISHATESAVTLRELYSEIGPQATINHCVAQYFDQVLDFDIERATQEKTIDLSDQIEASLEALQQQAAQPL